MRCIGTVGNAIDRKHLGNSSNLINNFKRPHQPAAFQIVTWNRVANLVTHLRQRLATLAPFWNAPHHPGKGNFKGAALIKTA